MPIIENGPNKFFYQNFVRQTLPTKQIVDLLDLSVLHDNTFLIPTTQCETNQLFSLGHMTPKNSFPRSPTPSTLSICEESSSYFHPSSAILRHNACIALNLAYEMVRERAMYWTKNWRNTSHTSRLTS
jgi:hypothetical protein